MTHSMTAFARVQGEIESTMVCWELKSVNHRYLEPTFRLPEAFRFMEMTLRKHLQRVLHRGKLECHLKLSEAAPEFMINDTLVNALLVAGDTLTDRYQLANDLTVSQILNWPGITLLNHAHSESMFLEVESLFHKVVNELKQLRGIEGQALHAFILARIKTLQDEIDKARLLTNDMAFKTREKWHKRLKLLQTEVDSTRLEQEIAMLLTRLDVSEELDRLETHVYEVVRVLNCEEPVGRRLDFLMQELNREANTLSAKSDSSALTQRAVEMKVLIEQMREQVQNIE